MNQATSETEPKHPTSNGAIDPIASAVGTYLVHLGYAMPIDHKDLVSGLERIGFHNLRFVDKTPADARFLGQLSRQKRLVDTALLTWKFVSPIGVDIHAPVPDLARVRVTPYELEPGAHYEMRLLSRLKLHPNNKEVEGALRAMGFAPSVVVLLGTDRERQQGVSTSVGAWYARASWTKPKSFATPEDDFYFEQLIHLPKG